MQEFFIQYFGQYYGIDWIAMTMSLLCMYFLGDKKRIGFIVGLIAGISWIYVNYVADIFPGVILNLVLIVLYVRGYIKWKKDKK